RDLGAVCASNFPRSRYLERPAPGRVPRLTPARFRRPRFRSSDRQLDAALAAPSLCKWQDPACGTHGSHVFYKACLLAGRSLSLGQFVPVRCRPAEPRCLAELRLLWEDGSRGDVLACSRLYFLPQDTPGGRSWEHGEDEVLAVEEKVVVRLQDLLQWVKWAETPAWTQGFSVPGWPSQTPVVYGGGRESTSCVGPQSLSGSCGLDVPFDQKTDNVNEPSAHVDQQQNGHIHTSADPPACPLVMVVSYSRYCRVLAIAARLRSTLACPCDESSQPLLRALGGGSLPDPGTRLLYCRNTFRHGRLADNPSICTGLDDSGTCLFMKEWTDCQYHGTTRYHNKVPSLRGRSSRKRWSRPIGVEARLSRESRGSGEETEVKDNNIMESQGTEQPEVATVPQPPTKELSPVESLEGNSGAEDDVGMEETAFLERLYAFMRDRGTPIERLPHLGFKQIDLWIMFKTTQRLGGYIAVTEQRLWKAVYDKLGGDPSSTSAATCTRRHYERLVLPYERHLKGEEDKPLPLPKPRRRCADTASDSADSRKRSLESPQPPLEVGFQDKKKKEGQSIKKTSLKVLAKGRFKVAGKSTAVEMALEMEDLPSEAGVPKESITPSLECGGKAMPAPIGLHGQEATSRSPGSDSPEGSASEASLETVPKTSASLLIPPDDSSSDSHTMFLRYLAQQLTNPAYYLYSGMPKVANGYSTIGSAHPSTVPEFLVPVQPPSVLADSRGGVMQYEHSHNQDYANETIVRADTEDDVPLDLSLKKKCDSSELAQKEKNVSSPVPNSAPLVIRREKIARYCPPKQHREHFEDRIASSRMGTLPVNSGKVGVGLPHAVCKSPSLQPLNVLEKLAQCPQGLRYTSWGSGDCGVKTELSDEFEKAKESDADVQSQTDLSVGGVHGTCRSATEQGDKLVGGIALEGPKIERPWEAEVQSADSVVPVTAQSSTSGSVPASKPSNQVSMTQKDMSSKKTPLGLAHAQISNAAILQPHSTVQGSLAETKMLDQAAVVEGWHAGGSWEGGHIGLDAGLAKLTAGYLHRQACDNLVTANNRIRPGGEALRFSSVLPPPVVLSAAQRPILPYFPSLYKDGLPSTEASHSEQEKTLSQSACTSTDSKLKGSISGQSQVPIGYPYAAQLYAHLARMPLFPSGYYNLGSQEGLHRFPYDVTPSSPHTGSKM
uniref:AT-rich interactive domain-containing protein 5B-like n=1 Tax=Myxine glutinosa TaxID=7769 RepID=UPI00358F377E